MKHLVCRSPELSSRLFADGASLLRELRQANTHAFRDESESLKFLLDRFGLLTDEIAAEDDLVFDDLLSGYVFRNNRRCFLGDNYVLRNKPLSEINKVEELFRKK